MTKYHSITDVQILDEKLSLVIDGEAHSFPLSDVSPRLQKSSDFEVNMFEISPSGYGIHWPLLDEDISIDGLLAMKTVLKLAA